MKPIFYSLACLVSALPLTADVLEKKDGTVLDGTFAGGTSQSIRFTVNGEVQVIPTSQILAITFTGATAQTTQSAPNAFATTRQPVTTSTASPRTLPAGTPLVVSLGQTLSSKTAQPGMTFRATLVSDVRVGDSVVLPAGSPVTGTIVSVTHAGRGFNKESELTLQLSSATANGKIIPLSTRSQRQAHEHESGTVVRGTAKGALLGTIAGAIGDDAGEGALAGAAVGAAASTLRRGEDVEYTAGTVLAFELNANLAL